MTDERIAVEALGRCRLLPGSWNKRFVRALGACPEDHALTAAQRQTLWKLVRHYRRQLPPPVVSALARREALPPLWAGFEDALDADPKDAATRAVFADWLEERGEAALAAAHRHIIRCDCPPFLTPCGMSYGPNGDMPMNYEWTFGMKVWGRFGSVVAAPDYLRYCHRSQWVAVEGLARALAGKGLVAP